MTETVEEQKRRRPLRFLGERAIDLDGLEAPIRRIIFTTFAVILGLAFATAARQFFGGTPYVVTPGIPIAPLVAWIGCLGAALSLTLMIGGAGHIRSRWRFVVIAPVVALAIYFAALTAPLHVRGLPDFAWTFGLLLPLPFAVAGSVAVILGPRLKLTWLLFVAGSLILGFIGACSLFSVLVWPSFAPSMLFWIINSGAVTLTPALMAVGGDIAEIGGEAAAGAMKRVTISSHELGRFGRTALILLGASTAAAMEVGLGFRGQAGHLLTAIWVALTALAAGISAALILRRQSPLKPGHLGFWPLLLTSAVVQLASLLSVAYHEPQPGAFNYMYVGHQFSLRLPAGMTPVFRSPSEDGGTVHDNVNVGFLTAKHLPQLGILGVLRPPFAAARPSPTMNAVMGMRAGALAPMPIQLSAPDSEGWRHGESRTQSRLKDGDFQFFVFAREDATPMITNDMNWYIGCGDTRAKARATLKMCRQATRSFASEVALQASRRAAVILDVALWLAAGAAGVAIWSRGRRGDPATLDFVFWVFWLNASRGLIGFFAGGIEEPFDNLHVLAVTLFGVIMVALAASLTLEAFPRRLAENFDLRSARATASGLLASLITIASLFYLYVFAAGRSEESQTIRGVVICLALVWELIIAGPTINLSAKHHKVPRSSRVLIFVGYLIAVATCVFMLSPNKPVYGLPASSGLDTEGYVASGIVLLGSALLVSRALREVARLKQTAQTMVVAKSLPS